MDAIFHEKQEGSLCAQHCLNSLLQGAYFSAVDLASIARDLDEDERQRMAEGDVNSPEYLNFIQQPSSNMDDSGYFSIQVISKALRVWGLELIPFGSNDAVAATIHPEKESAFICNFKDHWLTIRKLGYQWFNLNSLLTGPELLSDTYLSMFLNQLQREGYSIFVARGRLADNEADQVLRLMPAVQTQRPITLAERNQQLEQQRSSAGASSSSSSNVVSLGDLQNALKTSMKGASESKSTEPIEPAEPVEVRQKRSAFLDRFDRQQQQGTSNSASTSKDSQGLNQSVEPNSNTASPPSRKPVPKPPACKSATNFIGGETEQYENDDQVTEEAMLEAAIRMSMQSDGGNS